MLAKNNNIYKNDIIISTLQYRNNTMIKILIYSRNNDITEIMNIGYD